MDHNHPTEAGIPLLEAPQEGDPALPEGFYPWRSMLDERQLKLIAMCELYDRDDMRFGIPDHLWYMTVSMCVRLLDMYEQGILEAAKEEQARLGRPQPQIIIASA